MAGAAVRLHLAGRGLGADADALAVDQALQRLAAAEVDLHTHQVGAELDDGGLGVQRGQGPGGLQAEQAAADDGAAHRLALGVAPALLLDPAAQCRDVVDGAVDEDAREVVPGDRRHRGAGAGGEHELVVGVHLAEAVRDGLRRAVDRLDLAVGVQGDERVGPEGRVAQGDALGTLLEPAGQPHAVVGGAGLFREHGHAVAAGVVPGAQRLDEPLRDHATADHHKVLRIAGIDHVLTVGRGFFAPVRPRLPEPNIFLTGRGAGR